MEDLKKYIQAYGREKKLGIIESVDYQNAKAARAELAYLYKTVLGKDRLDRDLSPHEVMKAVLDEYNKREEFIRELSCSLGFGDPVAKPDNIDQKEKDILERVEKLKDGVWPCENSSTFAEHLRKEFPKFCKEYNVAPLEKDGSIHYWLQYIFDVLTEYRDLANSNFNKAEGFRKEKRAVEDSLAELRAKIREIYISVVDDEWDEHLSYTSAMNDINEEYKRVARNFEKDVFRDMISDLNRQVTELKHGRELLIEFRDDVAKAIGIGYYATTNVILHNVKYLYKDREDAYGMVAKLNDQVTALEKAKDELQQMLIASQKQVKGWTNRCDSLADTQSEMQAFRIHAIEDLKTRGFCFRPEEDETLPEIYDKLLKRYDWAYGEYKEQYRLRQAWYARWGSENERANGEHKRAEKLRKDVTALSNHIELLKLSNASQANSVVASQAFKNECRKLKEEKAKVIAALGQDIWDDCVKEEENNE